MGNLMGAAISNLYYPEPIELSAAPSRGVSVTAQAIIGSEVIEFWPDIVRHHRRKQAEKLARQRGREAHLSACSSTRGPGPPLPPTLSRRPYRGVTLTRLARHDRTPWQASG